LPLNGSDGSEEAFIPAVHYESAGEDNTLSSRTTYYGSGVYKFDYRDNV